MIDVVEHIVTNKNLNFLFDNIKNCLKKDGYFILTGYFKGPSKKQLFYVKKWNEQEILNHFLNYEVIKLMPFRSNNLMCLQK